MGTDKILYAEASEEIIGAAMMVLSPLKPSCMFVPEPQDSLIHGTKDNEGHEDSGVVVTFVPFVSFCSNPKSGWQSCSVAAAPR